MAETNVVHVAGPVNPPTRESDVIQQCSRCGEVMTTWPLTPFGEGDLVRQLREGHCASWSMETAVTVGDMCAEVSHA